jgi:hypothetical protein
MERAAQGLVAGSWCPFDHPEEGLPKVRPTRGYGAAVVDARGGGDRDHESADGRRQ